MLQIAGAESQLRLLSEYEQNWTPDLMHPFKNQNLITTALMKFQIQEQNLQEINLQEAYRNFGLKNKTKKSTGFSEVGSIIYLQVIKEKMVETG